MNSIDFNAAVLDCEPRPGVNIAVGGDGSTVAVRWEYSECSESSRRSKRGVGGGREDKSARESLAKLQ